MRHAGVAPPQQETSGKNTKRRAFLPVFLYFAGGFARLLWWDGRIILLT
jgi:hypothetical protein